MWCRLACGHTRYILSAEPSGPEVTGESTFVHFKFKVVSKKEQNHHDHDSYVLRVLDKVYPTTSRRD